MFGRYKEKRAGLAEYNSQQEVSPKIEIAETPSQLTFEEAQKGNPYADFDDNIEREACAKVAVAPLTSTEIAQYLSAPNLPCTSLHKEICRW